MFTVDPLKRQLTDTAVNSMLQAWELLRTQHREIPAQAVTVLLYIASHNPCHKQSIEEDQGLSTASCSRMVDFLSANDSRPNVKNNGLGFVEKYSDPSNGRRFLLKLTPQGEMFIQQIKDTLC